MISDAGLAPFGSAATICLLPHFTAGHGEIRTLGGRVVCVDPAAARLAADLLTETRLDALPLDDIAIRTAFDRLRAENLLAILPAGTEPASRRIDTIILSPHVDDAALSVGLQLAARRGHGRRIVCNIFSDQSYQTGLRVPAPALRTVAHAEDRLAGRILDYERCDLGLAGAQDRHGLSLARTLGWNSDRVRADPVLAQEVRELADRLAAFLAGTACRNAAVLAPAGIGGHLDHVLVALAARELLAAGALSAERLTFYEDLPYAAATPRLPDTGNARRIAASRKALALKLAALAVFRTRLREPQIALCAARANALGGGNQPAERTFAAPPAVGWAMDSGRLVGSMAQ
jgi:LmbE family N-acetylglucosaminyl deacetylase